MPKKSRQRKGGRVTPKGTRPPGVGAVDDWAADDLDDDDGPGLLDEIADALEDDHPLSFLSYMSGLLALFDDRNLDPDDRPEAGETTGRDARNALVATLVGVVRTETSAALEAIAALTADRDERARLRREVSFRGHPLPPWLPALDQTEVRRAIQVGHVLGDTDSLLLGARLPTGQEFSAIVMVDHNLGGALSDAFAGPAPIDVVLESLAEEADEDRIVAELSVADARARIAGAIERWDLSTEGATTSSWPASRPLIEWLLGRMPEGGSDGERPAWEPAALADLAARFFGSPSGADLEGAALPAMLDDLLGFAADTWRDPMRWSPSSVASLGLTWFPAKCESPAEVRQAAELLRAFIGFCHAERGIRPLLTTETLVVLDRVAAIVERSAARHEAAIAAEPPGSGG